MGKSDSAASAVKNALADAEAACPGISLELSMAIIKKSELNVSLNESILRLQGTPDDAEGWAFYYSAFRGVFSQKLTLGYFSLVANQYKTTRNDDVFRELSKKSAQLKRILSRIPDEIIDRKTFLETIK